VLAKLDWVDTGALDMPGNLIKNFKNERVAGHSAHLTGHGGKKQSSVCAELCSREALQNSVDAHRDPNYVRTVGNGHEPSRMHLIIEHLHGAEKQKRAELLNLIELQKFLTDVEWKSEQLPSYMTEVLKRISGSGEKPLRILFIVEENASGMYFTNPYESRFKMALLSHNETNKGVGSGGSFGQGKGALGAASGVCTLFTYSNFPWVLESDFAKDVENLPTSLFMGSTFLPSMYKGKGKQRRNYSGFGTHIDPDYRSQISKGAFNPFVDERAKQAAEKAGLLVRNRNGLLVPRGCEAAEEEINGSVQAIIEPMFSAKALEKAVLDYFWLGMCAGTLEVTLTVEGSRDPNEPNGRKTLNPVDYTQNRRLYGFPESFELIKNSNEPYITDTEAVVDCNGRGTAAAMLVDSNIREHAEKQIERGEKVNSSNVYALARNNYMISHYMKIDAHNFEGHRELRGLVLAQDAETQELLRRSEPKTHDNWPETASDFTDEEQNLHKANVRALKDGARKTVNELGARERKTYNTDKSVSQLMTQWAKPFNAVGKGGERNTQNKRSKKKQTGMFTLLEPDSSRETVGVFTIKGKLQANNPNHKKASITPIVFLKSGSNETVGWKATTVKLNGETLQVNSAGTYLVDLEEAEAGDMEIYVENEKNPECVTSDKDLFVEFLDIWEEDLCVKCEVVTEPERTNL